MNPATISRIYRKGGASAEHLELRDNTVIVEPVREPLMTAEGVVLVGAAADRDGLKCFMYRVIAHGKLTRPDDLRVGIGDVVDLINAMLDPLHENREAARIDVKHIFAIFERADQPGFGRDAGPRMPPSQESAR